MESIGDKLRQTRETKGYTIEQIARDTHIAKRFLEALEHEEFTVFPGEPYLLGFMRTYSEYLGLDPAEVVALYRNLKLQEQPAPIDELISKGGARSTWRLVFLIVVIVAALGAGAYFLITSGILHREEPVAEVLAPEPAAGTVFELTGEWVEQRFGQGDRILVPVGEQDFTMDLARVGDALSVRTPQGEITIEVGVETAVDLSGDGRPDLRVILRSVDLADSPPTVVMRLNRGAQDTAAATVNTADGPLADTPAISDVVGSTSEPSRMQNPVRIAEFTEKDEFLVDVRFEGYTLFRYEIDNEPRAEQYFQQGQTLRASVREQFRLWASNAGAARVRVAGKDLVLGAAGEVTAALITWVDLPDSDGVALELIPVY